jgi:hypothetical protein
MRELERELAGDECGWPGVPQRLWTVAGHPGEYRRKVPQRAWIWGDWYARAETLTCAYALLWMCCLLVACKRSGFESP